MRRAALLALAIAMTTPAIANAQAFVSTNVTVNTTWGPGLPNTATTKPCPVVLENPIFVKDGATLTILPNCVVRGQPRSAAVQPGVIAGSPGALVVTQTGRINAVGSPAQPITFTTAAIDVNGDGNPDKTGSFFDTWTGVEPLLDANPTTKPVAPLAADGNANVSLWGGMVIEGNAPNNLADAAGIGYGKNTVEGLTVPGFPVADATYGGESPHDNSGTMRYVSIRYAGDEIGEGNELNCLTLAGVGDGTDLSYIECYVNFDDGIEWFGGTVNSHHIVVVDVGDDSVDVDQGFTGTNQFVFIKQANFDEDDGDNYGSGSGDKGLEGDGDDPDANVRFRVTAPFNTNLTCWPLQAADWWNVTVLGSSPLNNNATNPNSPNRGWQLRNGYAGNFFNGMIVNTLGAAGFDIVSLDEDACALSETRDNLANGLINIVSSTFDRVDAFSANATTASTNGNALAPQLGAPAAPLSSNVVNSALFAGLENSQSGIEGKGVGGYLDPAQQAVILPTGKINPEPKFGLSGVGNGVPPNFDGADTGATYRGAFLRQDPNGKWTAGWTVYSQAGLMVDN